jgi:hypothetical protein
MNLTGFSAARAGSLPNAGAAIVAGIRLPAGTLVRPEGDDDTDVLWITKEPVAGVAALWGALADAFPKTGLWPLILQSLEGQPDRPWDEGELEPDESSDPDDVDVAEQLAEWWSDNAPDEGGDEPVPFGARFPGLAAPSTAAFDPGAAEAAVKELEGRLGLVPVTRPADAVAAIGWMGPANYNGDMGLLAAVLRSWEDRFGAFVVGIGFDTLFVSVGRPPATDEEALTVAAEHFAVCPDNVWQNAVSFRDYAAEIKGRNVWAFWWD